MSKDEGTAGISRGEAVTIEIGGRLHGVAVSIGMEWTAEHRQHVFDTMKQAASLLLALDAERGRLREALKPFADAWDVAMACHSPQMTMGRLGIVASHEVTGVHFRNARSALQHPDTKGT